MEIYFKYVMLFVVFNNFVTRFVCSEQSELYKQYAIEDDELCSPVQKRSIKLGRGHESGLLINQKRLSDHAYVWSYNLNCNFYVDASKYHSGIYAVIERLNLRKNATTNECIDYVQFTSMDWFGHRTRHSSPKYCGVLGVNIFPLASFVDEVGRLHVQISISKVPLLADQLTDVSLVFTAYSECHKAVEPSMPCVPEQQTGCIWEKYWGDKIPNCPSQDCIDESGCEDLTPMREDNNTDPAPVTLGAVTTVLLILLLFMICLWIFRKNKICCWGPHCQQDHNERTINLSNPTVPPVIDQQEPYPLSPSPSAPPVEPEKDPPPSYDDLFPSGR